jgi:hypothetical protein
MGGAGGKRQGGEKASAHRGTKGRDIDRPIYI